MQLVKNFQGHSGCTVELYRDQNTLLVKKSGSDKLQHSADILNQLRSMGFFTPEIYQIDRNSITMQYINGVDMKNYIAHADINQIDQLLNFVNRYIEKFIHSPQRDISTEIINKLQYIEHNCNLSDVQVDLDLLYNQLPKKVPVDSVHGDFTLDNMLYYQNNFYLIDANPTDINSVYYDAAKLLQDLDCNWFIRQLPNKTNYKVATSYISRQLKKQWQFLNNHYILIFMLLRILPYATQTNNRNFLTKEINRLWQL